MDQPPSSNPIDPQYQEALKAVENFNKSMQDVMAVLTRWYEEVWLPVCKQLAEAVRLMTVRVRRGILYYRLLDHHCPVWLAKFIAKHYPEHRLPFTTDHLELMIGILASSKLYEEKGK